MSPYRMSKPLATESLVMEQLPLAHLLVESGLLPPDSKALFVTELQQGLPPAHILEHHGLCREDEVLALLCNHLRCRAYSPQQLPYDSRLRDRLRYEDATRTHAIPVAYHDGILTVAMLNPLNTRSLERLEIATDCRIRPIPCRMQDYARLMHLLYGDAPASPPMPAAPAMLSAIPASSDKVASGKIASGKAIDVLSSATHPAAALANSTPLPPSAAITVRSEHSASPTQPSRSSNDALLSEVTSASETASLSKTTPYSERTSQAGYRLVDPSQSAGTSFAVEIVNSLLEQAIRERASDIHCSPEQHGLRIRFRIDGRLRPAVLPAALSSALNEDGIARLLSRIKIVANMDISISRVPQDGRFTFTLDGREYHIRVSCLPTVHGENMVLRLLNTSHGVLALEELGMAQAERTQLSEFMQRPYGLILSTGPTGSGKSTSLHALLQRRNKPDINIITLEDPVEYRMEGIRQAQLNTRAGMTFASGLRALLRQDPDIIMVGEIRDAETADIAVQAALTGHLVLSTLHTNDAAGAVTRLLDMGIEPYKVASVLLCAFAQRLVRTICPHCRTEITLSAEEHARHALPANALLHTGTGCQLCGQTGYMGRTGVFEVMPVTSALQEAIIRRASTHELRRLAQDHGMQTLAEDALDKLLSRRTTLQEIASLSVAQESTRPAITLTTPTLMAEQTEASTSSGTSIQPASAQPASSAPHVS